MAFLPAIPAALTIASTSVAALGTAAAALASHNASEFQAELVKRQGQQAADQAGVKASEVAVDSRQRLAAARAGAIQGGFDVSGSMSDLLDQTERQGNLDYLTAVYDGRAASIGANASSEMYKRQASSALIGGALGAGAQALGGVSKLYKMRGASIAVNGTE